MTKIRVGTAMTYPLLQGGHAVAKPLLERAAAGGLDHVFVADHLSFQVGFGMDGLMQAALIAGLEPRLEIDDDRIARDVLGVVEADAVNGAVATVHRVDTAVAVIARIGVFRSEREDGGEPDATLKCS